VLFCLGTLLTKVNVCFKWTTESRHMTRKVEFACLGVSLRIFLEGIQISFLGGIQISFLGGGFRFLLLKEDSDFVC